MPSRPLLRAQLCLSDKSVFTDSGTDAHFQAAQSTHWLGYRSHFAVDLLWSCCVSQIFSITPSDSFSSEFPDLSPGISSSLNTWKKFFLIIHTTAASNLSLVQLLSSCPPLRPRLWKNTLTEIHTQKWSNPPCLLLEQDSFLWRRTRPCVNYRGLNDIMTLFS